MIPKASHVLSVWGTQHNHSGKRCDLEQEGKKHHHIGAEGLVADPLKRERVVEGKKTDKVMKLCGTCYRRALVERARQSDHQKTSKWKLDSVKQEPPSAIAQGEELFLDYGPSYNPFQFLPIKKEPE